MRWARNVALVTIMLAALAGAGVLYGVNPPAASGHSWVAPNVLLALNIVITVLHVGAAFFFLLTLRIYKAKLKPAYVLICLGIVGTALGTLQIPLLNAFSLMDSPWVTRGGVGLPFLLGGVFAYAGVRLLAQLVGLKSLLASYKLVTPVVVGLCLLAAVLPRAEAATNANAIAITISSAINIWTGGFILAASLLVWQVMRTMGSHYHNTTLSLSIGFLISAMAMLCVTIETLLNIEIDSNPTIVLLALSGGIAYLYAGYAFAKTEEY